MAYTEFFCTKGSSANDLNGGGPRLGTNDAAVYTTADSTVAGGALTTVVDNSGSNWAGVLVDDFICWDTGGVKELRRVSALAPGGDATKITIASAATAGANKATRVGGAWATVDFGASTVAGTLRNAANNPCRFNVKYSATAYSEQVTIDNNGVGPDYPLTFEGYETTAGDGCPNDNLPLISSSGTAISGGIVFSSRTNLIIRNLRVEMSGNAVDALYATTPSYVVLEHLRLKATGTGARGLYMTGSNVSSILDIYVEDSTAEGIYIGAGHVFGCRVESAGTYGIRTTVGASVAHCVVANPGDDGIYIAGGGYANFVVGCTVYGSVAGSGVYFPGYAYGASVYNCLLVSNNQYGIECARVTPCSERYNAFYLNGVNECYRVDADMTGASAHQSASSVTLTGDPFTNAAGGDFSLDNVAGQGAACRDAGFPGTLLDGTNIGNIDIGALQHDDPVGGGVKANLTGGFLIA